MLSYAEVLLYRALVFFAVSLAALGHAPPVFIPTAPFHVSGTALVDANGKGFTLRGVQITGLNAANPTTADLDAVRAMTPLTFRVIQRRWNLNTVRIPVSPAVWQRDGATYLDRIQSTLRAANDERLLVVLAADDASDALEFWRAAAVRFRETPAVIFSLAKHPAVRSIVDAIRVAGANQILSIASTALPFSGTNIIYEANPYFDIAPNDAARDALFGAARGQFPLYAGTWGIPFNRDEPACRVVPRDLGEANGLLFQILAWFDSREVSWTVADFNPGSLIADWTDYTATQLDRLWTCGGAGPRPGIGNNIQLWTTGDPGGFGAISPELIANVAGGPASPVAPGEVIAIYGQGLGPSDVVGAQLDASGNLTTVLGETQVFFDGRPGPMFATSEFQVNVQVPFEVAGQTETKVQLVYTGLPSIPIQLPVVETAPQIFCVLGVPTDAAALNQDVRFNSSSSPAARGSIVAIWATGAGVTSPPVSTGVPAQAPYPAPVAKLTLLIDGRPAEILFGGSSPGLVGLIQVNARIPADLAPGPRRASLVLQAGSTSSRAGVSIWIQ